MGARARTAPDGLVVVDKPAGMTSHDVVARLRRALGTRAVGHAGTLDPMATGVLVCGVERGTRFLSFLVGCDKEYTATIRLGEATTTDDAQGTRTGGGPADGLALADVQAALGPLRGTIRQRPSSVSAVKVEGRRAHERVRAGEDVVLPEREVHVHCLDLLAHRVNGAFLDLDVLVQCSSGTYVRALARDLGDALGVGGHLTGLRRTRVGPFDAPVPLGDVAASRLLPLAGAARALMPVVGVDGGTALAVAHGQRVPVTGLDEAAGAGVVAVVGPDGTLLAVSEPRDGVLVHRMVLVEPSGRVGT